MDAEGLEPGSMFQDAVDARAGRMRKNDVLERVRDALQEVGGLFRCYSAENEDFSRDYSLSRFFENMVRSLV